MPSYATCFQVYSYRGIASAGFPLGLVDVPLVRFGQAGAEFDEWHPLEPFGRLRAGGRLGNVRLRMKMGKALNRGGSARSLSLASDVSVDLDVNDGGDEPDDCRELPPNYLKVTMHRVRRAPCCVFLASIFIGSQRGGNRVGIYYCVSALCSIVLRPLCLLFGHVRAASFMIPHYSLNSCLFPSCSQFWRWSDCSRTVENVLCDVLGVGHTGAMMHEQGTCCPSDASNL